MPVLYYILPTICSLTFTVIAYRQFFNERSGKGTMKAVLSYVLGHIIYIMIFGAALAIAVAFIIKFRGHPH